MAVVAELSFTMVNLVHHVGIVGMKEHNNSLLTHLFSFYLWKRVDHPLVSK